MGRCLAAPPARGLELALWPPEVTRIEADPLPSPALYHCGSQRAGSARRRSHPVPICRGAGSAGAQVIAYSSATGLGRAMLNKVTTPRPAAHPTCPRATQRWQQASPAGRALAELPSSSSRVFSATPLPPRDTASTLRRSALRAGPCHPYTRLRLLVGAGLGRGSAAGEHRPTALGEAAEGRGGGAGDSRVSPRPRHPRRQRGCRRQWRLSARRQSMRLAGRLAFAKLQALQAARAL